MRSLLIAGLILLAAPRVQAQGSLPRFVFEGHRIGEARPESRGQSDCEHPASGQTVCVREVLDGISLDTYYTYNRGVLSHVGATVDSSAFEPLVLAFTKRYGHPRALRHGTSHDYAQWRFREGTLHLTRTGTLVVARFAAAHKAPRTTNGATNRGSPIGTLQVVAPQGGAGGNRTRE